MRTSGNGKSLCHEAKEYYYELLCHDDHAVPEAIARHVEGCSFCQQEIHRLRDTLLPAGDPADPSADPGDEGAVEALSRQFEFLGEHVRCSHVKPFLPDLLAPSPEIRIPTPITVHVENCPQCSKDLASIRELGLTTGQLRRLGRFYDQFLIHGPSHDDHTYATAAALAVFSLDGTAPGDLDHVSRCPQCRAWMHQQRANAMAALPAGTEGGGVLLCREVSTVDLFDYVMPFGLDAAAVGKADGRRDAVVTHVRVCRRCMEKAQSLHRTIYRIADRADSDVCTLYQCDDDTQDAECRYPVNVVVQQSEPAPAGAGFKRRSRFRVEAKPLFRRTAIAAAATIAVGLLLLVNAPAATGTSVGDLAKAVQRMANVHIVSQHRDNPEPIYEMWVSKDLNRIARKTPDECVEYDLSKELVKVVCPGLGAPGLAKLTPDQLDLASMFMNKPLGDIFTNDLSDASLSQVTSDPSADRPDVLASVYELTRGIRSSNGVATLKRWRVSTDSQQRPVEIEVSCWDSVRREWESETTMHLTYPTTTEMENEFKALPAAE